MFNPIKTRRRRILSGFATGGAALAIAAASFAYFLAQGSGSGTSHGNTGGAPAVALTITSEPPICATTSSPPDCPLTPSANPAQTGNEEEVVWQVSAPSTANITGATASVVQDASGNVVNASTGAGVPGCSASWFQVGTTFFDVSAPPAETNEGQQTFPYMIPQGTSYLSTTFGLVDSGTDQSACENISPEVTLSMS